MKRMRQVLLALLVLGAVGSSSGCSSGAHSVSSKGLLLLAQSAAPCNLTDSTLTCCIKKHPGQPDACGLTAQEVDNILRAVQAVNEAGQAQAAGGERNDTTPEWKQACIDNYVNCVNERWTGSCYDCLRYCEGQRLWPADQCKSRR